jgi:phosphatidylglycerol:prolipoprotein diacylglycerol transferase
MIPFLHIGSLQIPTFFFVISLSLTGLLFLLSSRVDHFSKDRKIAFDLALLLMFSSFIGGRLLHVFYEEWDYYKADPKLILYFWQGGFVFLGGLAFSFITGYLYTRYKKISFLEWADFFTPLFSLAHSFGRIGCFLSGCCFGAQCTLPWAYAGNHPTALYLSIGEFFIFLILLSLEKKQVFKFTGGLFNLWLLLHSLLRFNIEYLRNDFRGLFINFPLLGSLSVSQMLSLIIIVSTLGFFYFKYKSVHLKN